MVVPSRSRAGELLQSVAIGIGTQHCAGDARSVYGYLGNSTALMAYARHHLSNVFGLLVAWALSVLSKRLSERPVYIEALGIFEPRTGRI